MSIQTLLEARGKVTPAEKRAFARQIDRLIRQTGRLESQKVDSLVALLKAAQSDIGDRLRRLPKGAAFSRAMARELKAETERLMRVFATRAADQLGDAQERFAKLGSQFNGELISAQGRKPGLLTIPPELVENAATRSADLIRSLSQRQVAIASDIMNVGVISGRHPLEVASEMAEKFGKSISQMETIARTEMLGMHSQVQYAQLLDMAETSPGLRKEWLTVIDGRQRETHEEVNGTVLPIDEPFQVGDSELQYPRDPAGEIKEVANCRCVLLGNWDDVGASLDAGPVELPMDTIADEVERSLKRDNERDE